MRDKVLGDTRWANADCFAADLSNPFDVEKLVSQTCVVANIAGPFMLTGGERIVEACIHYDTDYCDVSGEIPWSAKLLEFHDLAREAGVYIVPSAAFAGGVPDLGCYLIQRGAPRRANKIGIQTEWESLTKSGMPRVFFHSESY